MLQDDDEDLSKYDLSGWGEEEAESKDTTTSN
jgi:hypothetical protein